MKIPSRGMRGENLRPDFQKEVAELFGQKMKDYVFFISGMKKPRLVLSPLHGYGHIMVAGDPVISSVGQMNSGTHDQKFVIIQWMVRKSCTS